MPGRKYEQAGSSYRYSINRQEKTPEVAPNTTTAEFWQYDARIVRRWNVDPVVKEYESPYAAFANNPIWFADQDGADTSKYLTNSQLLDAVKMARKQAQKVVQDKGDYNDKSYQENLLQQAKDYSVKNNLDLNAALEFQKQSNTYFRLYYWQWSWSKHSNELLGQDDSFGGSTDSWKIKIQVYTIQLYEQKHRTLKGTALSFAGILTQYSMPKLTDISIAGKEAYMLPEVLVKATHKNLINIRSSTYKSMGTIEATIKNNDVLKYLYTKRSQGTWVKVYDAAYINGQKAEIHYFLHKETGIYFDSKIKQMGWSQQFLKGKNKIIE